MKKFGGKTNNLDPKDQIEKDWIEKDRKEQDLKEKDWKEKDLKEQNHNKKDKGLERIETWKGK